MTPPPPQPGGHHDTAQRAGQAADTQNSHHHHHPRRGHYDHYGGHRQGYPSGGTGGRSTASHRISASPAHPPPVEDSSVVLVTASYDHTIRMWDALKTTCTRTIDYSNSQINRMALSPDKRYLAVAGKYYCVNTFGHSANKHVCLYDVFNRSQEPILTLDEHKQNVTAVQFSQDMRWLITSSEDKRICWWDLRAGTCRREFKNNAKVNDAAIHPNPHLECLVSCDQNGQTRVWCARKPDYIHQVAPESDVSARCLAISPDGTLVAVANSLGRVFLWQFKTKANDIQGTKLLLARAFDAHVGNYITRVIFSNNGRYLVTCSSDGTAKIWTVRCQKAQPEENSGEAEAAQQTPVATTTDPAAAQGRSNLILGRRTQRIPPLQLRRVSKADITVQVECMQVLRYHKRWVWDAAFSNDSGFLVT
ncbi:TOR complex subunit lst8, partial [Spiromyces aspiralis]